MGFHAQNDVKEISRIGQWSTSELTLVAAWKEIDDRSTDIMRESACTPKKLSRFAQE
jgi:hypothetical protein